jgi:ATP-dependent Clp protease ATP-binding subunit ClpA
MLFQHYWKREMKDKSEIERAVNITHGLKFLEVEQLVTTVNPFEIGKFEEVVRQYKFGEKRGYWQEVTLDKIYNAGIYFTKEPDKETQRPAIQGQDPAVDKVIQVLINAVADIRRRTGGNPSSPRGVLFFAGPTGVGKTLMAQKLATFLFGSEDKLLRFDMSEYKEEFQVTRLYGAPPGYVGYESGGTLTTKIKENPFSVILFDEIEKAHPRIFDIFLQVLSDGRLTDSKGDTVYFAESVIIFTSNLGALKESDELLQELLNLDEEDENKIEQIQSKIRQRFRECVENYFRYELKRPEIFGRIGKDNIVVFDYITPKLARSILETQLSMICSTFNRSSQNEVPSLKIEMDVSQVADSLLTPELKKDIVLSGIREALHSINTKINDELSKEYLRAKANNMPSGIIKIYVNNNGTIDVRLQE